MSCLCSRAYLSARAVTKCQQAQNFIVRALLSSTLPSILAPRWAPLSQLLCSARRAFLATAAAGEIAANARAVESKGQSGILAPSSEAGPQTRLTLFVKKEGDADYALVMVEPTMLVGLLKRKIAEEFPSLRATDLSSLTLHVARDEQGKETGAALKIDALLGAALSFSGAATVSPPRIVVKGARDVGFSAAGRATGVAMTPSTSASQLNGVVYF